MSTTNTPVPSYLEGYEDLYALDPRQAALAWFASTREEEAGLHLATGVGRFWLIRGHWQEGQQWLGEALARGSSASTTGRMKALICAGKLAQNKGQFEAAQSFFEESRILARQAGDRRALADALHRLGTVAHEQGDY